MAPISSKKIILDFLLSVQNLNHQILNDMIRPPCLLFFFRQQFFPNQFRKIWLSLEIDFLDLFFIIDQLEEKHPPNECFFYWKSFFKNKIYLFDSRWANISITLIIFEKMEYFWSNQSHDDNNFLLADLNHKKT